MRRSRRNPLAAKYGRISRGYWRKKRRMPYGDSTANVGVWEEMDSQGNRVLRSSHPQCG